MADWISVRDRVPELGTPVLVYGESGYQIAELSPVCAIKRGYQYGWTDKGGGRLYDHDVQRWMSLPDPPRNLKQRTPFESGYTNYYIESEMES